MVNNQLWYKKPATDWNEALPIGNSSLGGMIFGGAHRELIQMNEETLWYGGYKDRHNKDANNYLPKIRALLWEGKISEAERLLSMSMFSTPDGQRQYSVLGDFVVDFYNQGDNIKNYRRTLDIGEALCQITYETEMGEYERTYFCSYPDRVLVAKFNTTSTSGLELSTYIDRWKYMDHLETCNNGIKLSGISGMPDGVAYHFEMTVETVGGTIENIGQRIYAKGCREVMIIVTAATSFNEQSPKKTCMNRIKEAQSKGYAALLESHLNDYKALAGRMNLEFYGEDLTHLPTDERLNRLREGMEDKDLVALYFKFGRYLMLSCSREGGLPATLQGIWNKDWQPPWDGKYTININTEMNYWIAEKCNLSECHTPLFDHLERMKPRGEETAQKMYNSRGWMAHHNTDIWGDTAPQDMWMPATIWPMGGAWLSLHIWQHYEYTRDMAFLKSKYEVLKGAGDFFKDYLMEDEKGYLVTGPTTSPENTYILPLGESGTVCIGPTMDNEILYELFTAIIEAGKLLGETEEEIKVFESMRSRLTPLQIGRYGQIMEWREDYEEAEPGHRHISQLFGLYPGNQISVEETPELARAAKATLERRLSYGGGHTGWSRAWIINLWARLKEGELAYENVLELLKKSTLSNLLDNHPPFQIDGNFGGAAGIAEMLMQDYGNAIEFLPALPKKLPKGKVTGLCARGGFVIDLEWNEGKMSKVHIYSQFGGTLNIRCKQAICLRTDSGNYHLVGEIVKFNTLADSHYDIIAQ